MIEYNISYGSDLRAITTSFPTTIEYLAIGGGGGGGGADGGYSGGAGRNATLVNGRVTLNPGEVIYAIAGGGGYGGLSRTSGTDALAYGSGPGGRSIKGWGGGRGGRAGTVGTSGYGGGGGGASVIFRLNTPGTPLGGVGPPVPSFNLICAAGGGGGGGGAGRWSNSQVLNSTSTPYGQANQYRLTQNIIPATYWAWGSFMNTYAVSADSGSSAAGSEWIVNRVFYVSIEQSYDFAYAVDNAMDVYLDGMYLGSSVDTYGKNDFGASTSRVLTVGWHRITAVFGNSLGSSSPSGYAIAIFRSGALHWSTRSVSFADIPDDPATSYRGGAGQTRKEYEDGGAGGGGGGGYPGGMGGTYLSGDNGGYEGSCGYSYSSDSSASITYGASLSANSSIWGQGGNGVSNSSYVLQADKGLDGFIILRSEGTLNIKHRSSLGWQSVNNVYYRSSNAWAIVPEVYYRNNGQWVKIHGDAALTISSSTAYSIEDTFNPPTNPQNWHSLPYTSVYDSGGSVDSINSGLGTTGADSSAPSTGDSTGISAGDANAGEGGTGTGTGEGTGGATATA